MTLVDTHFGTLWQQPQRRVLENLPEVRQSAGKVTGQGHQHMFIQKICRWALVIHFQRRDSSKSWLQNYFMGKPSIMYYMPGRDLGVDESQYYQCWIVLW